MQGSQNYPDNADYFTLLILNSQLSMLPKNPSFKQNNRSWFIRYCARKFVKKTFNLLTDYYYYHYHYYFF